jgi:hypothetical protein
MARIDEANVRPRKGANDFNKKENFYVIDGHALAKLHRM